MNKIKKEMNGKKNKKMLGKKLKKEVLNLNQKKKNGKNILHHHSLLKNKNLSYALIHLVKIEN